MSWGFVYYLWTTYPHFQIMSILSSFWEDFLKETAINSSQKSISHQLLKTLHPVELTEEKIVLAAGNQSVKGFLDKKLFEVEAILEKHAQKKLKVEWVVEPTKKKKLKEEPLLTFQPTLEDVFTKAGLHIKYQFANFAVSTTNQVAYAASCAVADNLGSAYNPLVLHGGVGVGKTHLAQAVARKILEKNQEKRVFFCPGDQFTNELIESIRNKSTGQFRRKYRYLNLLIVDDVQFIAGKQAVQEEFFHTFNSVVSAGGQIILTSDRPPAEIKNLEDRLRSRFSGGLVVDVQEPDFELRCAILLIKAKEKNIEIDIEAAKIIAQEVSDTRALEGTLLSLYTKILGTKEMVDLETVDDFFSHKERAKIQKVTPSDVIKAICSYYNLKQSQIKGPLRTDDIALPRQITMYILRNYLHIKLEEIANILKRKDHTTVIHAVNKVGGLRAKNPNFKEEVDRVVSSLELST